MIFGLSLAPSRLDEVASDRAGSTSVSTHGEKPVMGEGIPHVLLEDCQRSRIDVSGGVWIAVKDV